MRKTTSLSALQAETEHFAKAIRENISPAMAQPVWSLNHFISYGQSLSNGQEGWPALTPERPYGVMMIGESVRAQSNSSQVADSGGNCQWIPQGGVAKLKPMRATVDSGQTEAVPLSEAEQAMLPSDRTLRVLSCGRATVSGSQWEATFEVDGIPPAAGSKIQLYNVAGRNSTVYGSVIASDPDSRTFSCGFQADVPALGAGGSVAPPGAANNGEDLILGINYLAKRFLKHRAGAVAPARIFVASSCGVGGKKLAKLSRSDIPKGEKNIFHRLVQCARTASELTKADESYGIVAVAFCQGETDYAAGTSAETYKAQFYRWYDDFCEFVVRGVSGQTCLPSVFLFQTSHVYVTDPSCSISEAQRQIAMESRMPGARPIYLVAPYYHVTHKIGHRDANGYRWMQSFLGKVMNKVLNERQGWLPLCPIRVFATIVEGAPVVRIAFHVPTPPLRWGTVYPYNIVEGLFYAETSATYRRVYANKGFEVTDRIGVVPIESVRISTPNIVDITLGRLLSTEPFVTYGGPSTFGAGLLFDSDPTVSDEVYEYKIGSGQSPCVNIEALVGKPYPLQNPCVVFREAIDLAFVADPARLPAS